MLAEAKLRIRAARQPKLKDDVAVFDIAEIAQPLPERVEYRGALAFPQPENADARDFVRRLLSP